MRGVDAVTYERWLFAWAAVWGVPELPFRVRIMFSSRLQSSLGRCAPKAGLIRLNPGLLEGAPEALREVVCHEAAHVATWLLYGRRARAHGREWKDLMSLAGYEPRAPGREGGRTGGPPRPRSRACGGPRPPSPSPCVPAAGGPSSTSTPARSAARTGSPRARRRRGGASRGGARGAR